EIERSVCGSKRRSSSKPIPLASARFLINPVNASNPPAEAPTPTTGKWFGVLPLSRWVSGCTLSPSCVCLADIEREDVERFLRFSSDVFLWVAPPPEAFLRGFDFTDLARSRYHITPIMSPPC